MTQSLFRRDEKKPERVGLGDLLGLLSYKQQQPTSEDIPEVVPATEQKDIERKGGWAGSNFRPYVTEEGWRRFCWSNKDEICCRHPFPRPTQVLSCMGMSTAVAATHAGCICHFHMSGLGSLLLFLFLLCGSS
jgi:hypothetical protein